MAIASTRTLLPLDTFARVLGLNPLHFNGIHMPQMGDPVKTCADPFVQFAYQQSDRVGREEIAQAIADAEYQITDLLGFSPMPDYRDDYLDYEGMIAMAYNTPVLRLPRGYFIEAGVRIKTLLVAGMPVNYTDVEVNDPDEPTFYETALTTVSVPGGGIPESEVAIYFAGHAGDDAYEIRPVKVSWDAGAELFTITIPTAQLVDPDMFMGLNFVPVAADDITVGFVNQVDIYRVHTDATKQVEYNYYARLCQDNALCQPSGRVYTRESRLSMIYTAPANWDATALAWKDASWCGCGFPAGARVYYKSGLQGRDAEAWQRAITYYALSLLDRPMCACTGVEAMMKHWSDDLAVTESVEGNTRQIALAPGLLNNPLGTSRAAIYVWRLIQRYQIGESA